MGMQPQTGHQDFSAGRVPYSGGAQGPSPLATRLAISSYHSSLVLPLRKPIMTMVMLSQPTPPVSEFEAKQLSIMFSQIFSRSCLAAMPRRTNSTTAWEDWQSQIPGRLHSQSAVCPGWFVLDINRNIPSQAMTRNSSSSASSCTTTSG